MMSIDPNELCLAVFLVDDIILLAVIAAISYASVLLLAPRPPSIDALKDESDSVSGTRGTIAPLLLGYNKVVPVLGYVGNRRTWEKIVATVPDPDGFWEDDDNVTQANYRESAMHILCIGPAKRLTRILEGGKTIFSMSIEADTATSGSQTYFCTDPEQSRFRIYWGEPDQPIDTDLAQWTGVSSRYPNCCYIYWVKKELGGAAHWKKLEYVMECATKGEDAEYVERGGDVLNITVEVDDYLYGSKRLIVAPTYEGLIKPGDTVSLTGYGYVGRVYLVATPDPSYPAGTTALHMSPVIPSSIPVGNTLAGIETVGTEGRGVNPILAIRQMLFYGFPHGLSLNQDLFDMTSINNLIPYFAEGGTEVSPATVYIKQGKSYQSAIGSLMQDYGISIYPEATTGKYTFDLVRGGNISSPLTDDFVLMEKAEETKAYSVLEPQKVVYTFLDAAHNFTTSTMVVDDDGKASLTGNPNAKKVSLDTPTDIVTASEIVSRREQEVSIDHAITVPVSIIKESLNIGDTVTFDTINGVWRLVSKGVAIDESMVDMSFVLDAYSITNNYVTGTTNGIQISRGVEPDVYVDIFEGNRYLNSNQHGYYVIRGRSHRGITGAWLYKSADDVTANFQSGSSPLAFHVFGELTEDVLQDESYLASLEITADASDDSDFSEFWNITVSDADWRAGAVLARVGGELVSVKSATIIDPITVQLNDLLRGRFGTVPESHSIGAGIGFFFKGKTPFISDAAILDGESHYFRTRPTTPEAIIDLADVVSVPLSYSGGGYRPLAPDNLNTTNDAYAWIAGDDVELRWDYKNATSTTGAGFSLSDEIAQVSLPEGYFKITFLSGTTVKREVFEILTNTYTYDNGELIADFGGEPASFNVKVEEILNGLTSVADTATITKV